MAPSLRHPWLRCVRTLTVEPDFKSSGFVPEQLLTIGEAAQRAGVATSTIRYYERRGLLRPDARRSGQRRFREETVRAKRALEDTIGLAVSGYRAASFSVTRNSLWALDTLIDLGFSYDSSIFPIHHDLYGLPGATPEPHRVSAPSGRTLAEFPMSTASLLSLHIPVSGGGYFRILPYWLTRTGLKQINARRHRPFAFYLHPWELDPAQPRISVGAFSRFRHYTNLSRCEARLRRLLAEFSFTCMYEVLQERGLLSAERSSPMRQLLPIATGPFVPGRLPAG